MIEKIVTSLETSRKLKELGMVQESMFYWVRFAHKRKWDLAIGEEVFVIDNYVWENVGYDSGELSYDYVELTHHQVMEKISAWTTTELGCMLDLMEVDDDYIHHTFPDTQAQKGILDNIEMWTEMAAPHYDDPRAEIIKNLTQNLLNWRGG